MVDPGLPRSPRLVAEVLGAGSIPADLAAILAEHSCTVYKYRTARTTEDPTGWGLHTFLLHLVLGEVPVPSLESVTLVVVDEDGRVHLMHSLFSVRVNVYSTEGRLFTCLGELPTKGLPQVTEILPDFFAARRSVRAVPHMDHIAHLDGFYPRDWQTKPCKISAKAAGTEYVNLACRGLAFLPADYADWLLGRTADGPAKFFEASAGLVPPPDRSRAPL